MLEFPGRGVLFLVFLATLLVPLKVTLVVNRRTIDSFGWLNWSQGLAAPFLATAFGTFLLRHLARIPARSAAMRRRSTTVPVTSGSSGTWRSPVIRPTVGALALLGFL